MSENLYYYHLTHGEGLADQFDYWYAGSVIGGLLPQQIADWAHFEKPSGYYEMVGSEYYEASVAMAQKLSKIPDMYPYFVTKVIPQITTCTLLGYKPHYPAGRHIDANTDTRRTVLQVPLSPSAEEYAPLNFWTSMDQEGPPDDIAYSQGPGKAFVFDASKYHSVTNNEHFRWNFQIAFKEPLDEIVDMIKNKKFFRQI
jgi:hypothetical protein